MNCSKRNLPPPLLKASLLCSFLYLPLSKRSHSPQVWTILTSDAPPVDGTHTAGIESLSHLHQGEPTSHCFGPVFGLVFRRRDECLPSHHQDGSVTVSHIPLVSLPLCLGKAVLSLEMDVLCLQWTEFSPLLCVQGHRLPAATFAQSSFL